MPSGCFYPRPKVDSAIVRLNLYRPPHYTPETIEKASRVIRAAFSMRRKTLSNTLAPLVGGDKAKISAILASVGLAETVRGETLCAAQYVRLAEALAADASAEFTKSV